MTLMNESYSSPLSFRSRLPVVWGILIEVIAVSSSESAQILELVHGQPHFTERELQALGKGWKTSSPHKALLRHATPGAINDLLKGFQGMPLSLSSESEAGVRPFYVHIPPTPTWELFCPPQSSLFVSSTYPNLTQSFQPWIGLVATALYHTTQF